MKIPHEEESEAYFDQFVLLGCARQRPLIIRDTKVSEFTSTFV